MKKTLLALFISAALSTFASAQTSPNLTQGQVLTPAQWNALFAGKQDVLGYIPLNVTGGTMTGRLVTAAPGATLAGLNLNPGSGDPGTPANGDIWITSSGFFARVNGSTIGPMGAGLTSIGANTALGSIAGGLPAALSKTQLTTLVNTFTTSLSGSVPAPVTSTNKFLRDDGTWQTVGGSATITLGSSVMSGFTNGNIVYNNAGFAGQYGISGTGNVAMTTSPAFTTPALGVATATSLAIGGATIGANAMAITGGAQIAGSLGLTSNSSSAFYAGPNGATNPSIQIDASTASAASGIKITSKAAASGIALAAISSNANETLTLDAKGAGGVFIGATSNGGVSLGGGGGGVSVAGLTVTGSFTASGLVGYSALASGITASCAQYAAAASSTFAVPANVFCAETTTTFGATTTFDFSTFINTAVTLTSNITTQTLSNVKAGQSGTITFIQDATGSRTTVWNSIFKWAGGTAPTLSTAANAVDVLSFSCRSATFCVGALIKAVN